MPTVRITLPPWMILAAILAAIAIEAAGVFGMGGM